jgi:hypothetical protein
MPNSAIAQLIAQHLPAGLPHPGDPTTNQPPISIPLPAFRTTGMPSEMAETINNTTGLIAEAIVNLIETVGESEIVSKAELAKLRVADVPKGQPTPIMCSACRSPNPMLWVNLTDGPAYVDPTMLAALNTDCPHRVAT